MILNDEKIKKLAIEKNMIVPFHDKKVDGKGVLSYGLEPFGYTLTMNGDSYKTYTPIKHNGFDHLLTNLKNWMWGEGSGVLVGAEDYKMQDGVFVQRDGKWCAVIPPNAFILASTNERLKMPSNVQGQFLTKSTLARYGIFANVTWIDAGWQGWLTVELANLGRRKLYLPVNEGVGQIVFHEGDEPTTAYYGRYQNQKKAPQEAKSN